MVRLHLRLRNQNVMDYLRQKNNSASKPAHTAAATRDDIANVSTVLSLPALEYTHDKGKVSVLKEKMSPSTQSTPTTLTTQPTLPKARFTGPLSQPQPSMKFQPPTRYQQVVSPSQVSFPSSPPSSPSSSQPLAPRSQKTGVLPPLDLPKMPRTSAYVPAQVHTTARTNVTDTKSSHELLLSAPYILPLDATETSRLDFQHYALRQALGGNYAAPINKPQSILDVGTGTARWGIELATVFPKASVIGLDVMIPHLLTYPRNFAFVHGNVLDGLPFANATFDFVHQRLLLPTLPMQRLHFVLSELVRITTPAGWIELVEADINMQCGGSSHRKLVEWAVEASRRYGIDPRLGTRVGEFLSMMKLENIEVRSVSLPVGQWGGRIGRLMAADMLALYQAMKQRILNLTGISSDAYDYTCLRMQYEWEYYHGKIAFHIAYGQRK